MNRTALSLVLLSAIFATSAWGAEITDEATVVSVIPLWQTVQENKEQCWDERTPVAAPQASNAGQDEAASPQSQPQYTIVIRCHQIPVEKVVIKGYDVTYRYNGMEGHTVIQRAPKHKIKVGISALPDQ